MIAPIRKKRALAPDAETLRLGELLIKHADRIWEAEREVASRYADRSKTLVTFSSSVLGGTVVAMGLTLTRIDRLDLPTWAIVALAIVNLVLLGCCLWYLMRVPVFALRSVVFPTQAEQTYQRSLTSGHPGTERDKAPDDHPNISTPLRVPTASHELILPPEFLDYAVMKIESGTAIVAAQILQAAEELRERNLREKHRIQAGEESLTVGLRWVFVAIIAILAQFSLGLMAFPS